MPQGGRGIKPGVPTPGFVSMNKEMRPEGAQDIPMRQLPGTPSGCNVCSGNDPGLTPRALSLCRFAALKRPLKVMTVKPLLRMSGR